MPPSRSKFYLPVLVFLALLTILVSLHRLAGTPIPDKPGISLRDSAQRSRLETDPAATASSSQPLRSPSHPLLYERVLADARREGGDPESFWPEIQKTLSSTIREKIPEARLSERDLRNLTQNIRTLRESLQDLSTMDRSRENAEFLKNIRSQVDWTHEIFRETAGFSVAEFIQRVRDEKGIDHDQPDDEEVVVEYIHDPRP